MAPNPLEETGPMVRTHHEYDDIPGTFVFDAERAKDGYHLNMFCMSLMKDENRSAFKADEAKYLDRFPLTQEQRDAILNRDYNRMLELGGNIYFTAKLGATERSFVSTHRCDHDRLDPGRLCQDDVGGRPLG
jgi:protocatechuate 4,5-dioxygenase alpha subunit